VDLISVNYDSRDFDHFVRALTSHWEDAVELREQWGTLDPRRRLIYVEDWPVNNDIHQHLADYVAGYTLTEDQRERWAELNKLVAAHRKDLEDMGYWVRISQTGKDRAVA